CASARQYLLDLLIENKGLTDGTTAAFMAATVGWLVKTSNAVGEFIAEARGPIRSIHYNITTFIGDGRRAVNFRLVLGHSHATTIADWIKELPPQADRVRHEC